MRLFSDLKARSISLIVVAVLIFNGYSLFDRLQHTIKNQTDSLETNSNLLIEAQALASIKHYWTLDFASLEAILDGFQTVPEFHSATFYNEDDEVIAERIVEKASHYPRILTISKDLYTEIPGRNIYLGKLVYEVSYKLVDEYIRETLIRELINQLILVIFLCVCIYLIIEFFIAAPLRVISKTLTNIASGDVRTQIPFISRKDQIGDLARAARIFSANSIKVIDFERQARKEAEETNKLKDLFFARVTHELRTPLHGISGLTELLLKDLPEGEMYASIENISGLSKNMTYMVNEILDFSSMRENKIELDYVDVDLRMTLNKTSLSVSPLMSNNNNNLKVCIDDNLPQKLMMDGVRFEQVLFNLLSNAAKFTKDGVVTLSVNVDKIENNTVWLSCSVADTGIGISKEFQNKGMFDAFTQEDESINRSYGGTGLGLSIAYQMVRLMGGELKVESEKGEGSKFYFSIPLEIANVEDDKLSKDKSLSNAVPITPKNLLIVDDDPLNRRLLQKIVERDGHTAILAVDGNDAIACLQKNDIDLIFMDVMMPNKDGVEATSDIRKMDNEKANTPIFAVTAFIHKENEDVCRNAGMNGFLSKPFNTDDVAKIIHDFTQLNNKNISKKRPPK
tara:strand:- start:156570 stop:158441 length:1872 start_codon:yes stop_codon:yes gene_type:complete